MLPIDCKGCARRREAIRDFGRRMADWTKHPTGPLAVVPVAPPVSNAQSESLDRIRALSSLKAKMETKA